MHIQCSIFGHDYVVTENITSFVKSTPVRIAKSKLLQIVTEI